MTTPTGKTGLRLLRTGVPGLDQILGGGLPEFSFNLIAGTPGAGKTTLVHQFLFANATPERPALYFTVLGEPAIKMLRYQQQLAFFDPSKIGESIRYVDLSAASLAGDLEKLLEAFIAQVREASPSLIVIDSFRTLLRSSHHGVTTEAELQSFMQRLALQLATWQITSFLIGEYAELEMDQNPVFTIADGILWLTQSRERSSIVRKLQVLKLRGAPHLAGLHTFRIGPEGVQVFPRARWRLGGARARPPVGARAKVGVPELDELFGGGFPSGDLTLIAGPSGTGKTLFGSQFIAEGVKSGEAGVLAIFEETPEEYIERAESLGIPLGEMVRSGKLELLDLHPFDLSSEEILQQMQRAVARLGARRLVIDSLNGLELSLTPSQREDFRESLYRMVGGLSGSGVSVLLTVEVGEAFNEIKFSPHSVSFLAQNIIFLRYAEVEGRLQKILAVVKMRRSRHGAELHAYEITSRGLVLKGPLTEYQGVLTGVAKQRSSPAGGAPGLTHREQLLLTAIGRVNEASEASLAGVPGVSAEELSDSLARLVRLNYVIAVRRGDTTYYRVASRPLSALPLGVPEE